MMEKKRKTIRRLSLIFIAVVVVSMLAFAGAGAAVNTWIVDDTAGDYHKETIADAINAATLGDTVQLGKDIIELDESIYIDKDITLDLNGHVLESTVRVFEVNVDDNSATLTVTDSRPNYGEDDPNHMGYCNSDGVWNWKYSTSEYTEPYPIKGGIITTTFDGYWSGAVVINFESSNQKFVLNGGTIAGIHAVTMGGVMSMYNNGDGGGIFEMNGGCFFGNSTTNDCGGTVLNECGATVTVNKGDFINNVFYDTDYAADECERSGGGVFRVDCLYYSCNVNINGGNFINNKCKWVDGYENTYQPGGGAIFIYGCNESQEIVGTVNISGNVLFQGNEAPSGGAIGMVASLDWGGYYSGELWLKISGTGDNVPIFKENKAYNVDGQELSGLGGAINMAISKNMESYGNPYLEISIDGAKFENNTADKNGGAIFMGLGTQARTGSNLTIENAQISNNSAILDGGSIYLSKGTMIIGGNTSIDSNNATNGGAIYMENGTMDITGGTSGSTTDSFTISNNEATTSGGGIYLGGGEMTVKGITNIISNTAENGDGGGIYMNSGTMTVEGTSAISGNKATNGGGVYLNSVFGKTTSMTVDGTSSILLNEASENGGGVYMKDGTMNILGDTKVITNSAKDKGAGIYMESGKLKLAGNTYVTGNTLSNTTSGQGTGFYLGNASEVKIEDKVTFGDADELYINAMSTITTSEGKGIELTNWTGLIKKLGLADTIFQGEPTIKIMSVSGTEEESTQAADVINRIRLANEEKYILSNVKVVDWTTGETKTYTDAVFANLHTPKVVDATFTTINKKSGIPGPGTVNIDFVISEDNTADWYILDLYYKENPDDSWTKLSGITVNGQEIGTKMSISPELQTRKHWEIKDITFDENHKLDNGYYGIQLRVGKSSVSTTIGSISMVMERLHLVAYVPDIEDQPAQFIELKVGDELTDDQKLTVTAKSSGTSNSNEDLIYQWQYCTTGNPRDFYDLDPAVVAGADTNSIFPTADGSRSVSKFMDGFYRCKVSDATHTDAYLFSWISQCAILYDIEYFIGETGLEGAGDPIYGLIPDSYGTISGARLPSKEEVESKIKGYTFFGWFTDEDLTEDIMTIPSGTTGKVTIYGFITLIPYYLSLDVNGKGVWEDTGTTELRGGQKATLSESLYVNVGTTHVDKVLNDEYAVRSAGKRADVTTFGGWSVGPERTSPVVIDTEGNIVGNIDGYTDEHNRWIRSENTTLYAHWIWPDPVVYLESLGGQPIELSKVKVEVTNEDGDKFVYKSPKNDPSVGDFLEAGEKLNLAYGVDPVNGYFPEYDGWGVGHGEKVRVHVIYNNEHTLYDQEVMAI